MTYKQSNLLYNAIYSAFNPQTNKIETVIVNISCSDFNEGYKIANDILENEIKPANKGIDIRLLELKFISNLYEPDHCVTNHE